MSSALRRLAHQPNSGLAAQAFCDFVNLAQTGLVSAEQIETRLMRSTLNSTISEIEAIAAIRRGFAAARRKPS
jgi:hypothetical protein